MADDDRILELLAAVRHGDESGRPMANGLLVEHLGWTAADVAEWLGTARAQLLIWGLPGWGNPRPQFNELELTVQGRRLLETRASTGRQTRNRRPQAGKAAAPAARPHAFDANRG
jgi:hypothetical protein